MQKRFDQNTIETEIPTDLRNRVQAILGEHGYLRWDDAIQIVLDETQLDRVRANKKKAKKAAGNFGDPDDDDGEALQS